MQEGMWLNSHRPDCGQVLYAGLEPPLWEEGTSPVLPGPAEPLVW